MIDDQEMSDEEALAWALLLRGCRLDYCEIGRKAIKVEELPDPPLLYLLNRGKDVCKTID